MAGKGAPPPISKNRKAKAAPAPVKAFSVGPWTDEGEGERILIVADSGMGKTTLGALAPKPVFIGIDDGGRKIKDPRTGKDLQKIKGVETYEDVRSALQQPTLFEGYKTAVIDTFTLVEGLAEPFMFRTIKHEKGGTVKSLEGYGYGKGYKHLYDVMVPFAADCDRLIRAGKNVILICQKMNVLRANPGGEDFLEAGPKLSHPKKENNSVRLYYKEWADHVFFIDHFGVEVSKDGKATGGVKRAIFVQPEMHYVAKTRSLEKFDGHRAVAFESKTDDTLWQFLFPGSE
jgi:hypothetical protein